MLEVAQHLKPGCSYWANILCTMACSQHYQRVPTALYCDLTSLVLINKMTVHAPDFYHLPSSDKYPLSMICSPNLVSPFSCGMPEKLSMPSKVEPFHIWNVSKCSGVHDSSLTAGGSMSLTIPIIQSTLTSSLMSYMTSSPYSSMQC